MFSILLLMITFLFIGILFNILYFSSVIVDLTSEAYEEYKERKKYNELKDKYDDNDAPTIKVNILDLSGSPISFQDTEISQGFPEKSSGIAEKVHNSD